MDTQQALWEMPRVGREYRNGGFATVEAAARLAKWVARKFRVECRVYNYRYDWHAYYLMWREAVPPGRLPCREVGNPLGHLGKGGWENFPANFTARPVSRGIATRGPKPETEADF